MTAFAPQPPFDTWPVHVAEPRFGFVWYCDDGMLVAHWVCTHLTADAVNAYQDVVDRALRRYADDVRKAGGLHTIQDFRRTISHDSAARRAWQTRMSSRPRDYTRGGTAVIPNASPLFKMAVSGINMLAALHFGSSIELIDDIETALRKHRVRPPRAPCLL